MRDLKLGTFCALAALLVACSNDEGPTPDGGPDVTQVDAGPPDAEPDSGPDAQQPLEIHSEAHRFPVAAPTPPNPVTGEESPPETEYFQVVRYWAANASGPPQAIVVGYPGAQLGAGSYATLAENLIRASRGAIEFWAYERRSNALEDRTGFEAAVEAGDASVAAGYYFHGEPIDGRTFQGTYESNEPSFMSEWGLAGEIENLSQVLALVPEDKRKTNLVLLGFSLGAPVVQQYAAWDFGDRKGSDDLAALVILDGGGLRQGLTEEEYHEVGCVGSLGNRVGLDEMRASGPYYQDQGLGARFWVALELAAMRASGLYGDSRAEVQEDFLRQLTGLLLQRGDLHLTYRANFGALVDNQTSLAVVTRTSLGFFAGGPVEQYHNDLADEDLWRPADPDVLYDWLAYDETDPPELVDMEALTAAIVAPPTGALEWYAPVRLNLDVCAADDLAVTPDASDYRWNLGLKVTRQAEMDAPVFFFFAEYGELDDMGVVTAYRDSLPPVGPGRVNEGAPRDPSLPVSRTGFVFILGPGWYHMDAISAAWDRGREFLYEPLVEFILANTSGTVRASLP